MVKERSGSKKRSSKAWTKELDLLMKKRNAYLKKYQLKKDFSSPLTEKVPENLRGILNTAFIKAFEMIYDKGTLLLDKTYSKEKARQQYQVNRFAAEVKQDRRSLKAFSKQSNASGNINLLVSGIEGIGLGLIGCGLPDIPLLTGVILRSLYEISTNYGYDYSLPKERMYQLLIIQGAMSYGDDLQQCLNRLDSFAEENEEKEETAEGDVKAQIKLSASALADEMLFLKFVQGIPVVGVLGGISDSVFLHRIQQFAKLNYQYRMLQDLKKIYEGRH